MPTDAKVARYTARAAAVGLTLVVESCGYRLLRGDVVLLVTTAFVPIKRRIWWHEYKARETIDQPEGKP